LYGELQGIAGEVHSGNLRTGTSCPQYGKYSPRDTMTTNAAKQTPPASTSVEMTGEFAYPATLYSIPQIPNFPAYKGRKRLSGPNLREFLMIVEKWRINPKDVRRLLGGVDTQYYRLITAYPERRTLKPDQLTRVFLLLEIYYSLNKILGRKQTAKWVHQENHDWLFCGSAPLSYMVHEGILAIYALRNLLNAQTTEK